MNIILSTQDPQIFIEGFFGLKYDEHMKAWRWWNYAGKRLAAKKQQTIIQLAAE